MSDFLFTGVGKVVWIILYLPCYVALALTLGTYLGRTRFEARANVAAGVFLSGALLAHLLWVGAHSRRTFSMQLVSLKPVTMKAKDFPETLIVLSDNLERALAAAPPSSEHQIVSDAVVDYGCIRSYAIDSVDAIDINSDHEARWTLRLFKGDAQSNSASPGSEDQKFPWCRVLRFKVSAD